MLVCPDCIVELASEANGRGSHWLCPKCGNRAVGLSALGQRTDLKYVQRLSVLARAAGPARARPCPMCSNFMADGEAGDLEGLSICPSCLTVWISAAAYARIPSRPDLRTIGAAANPSTRGGSGERGPGATLTTEQQERLAAVLAQTAANRMRVKYHPKADLPETWWQRVSGYMGFPVACDDTASPPWATWIATAAIGPFAMTVNSKELTDLFENVTTSFFHPLQSFGAIFALLLHGNLAHVLYNLYFLLAFGSLAEDCLGSAGFVLLLIATITGNALASAMTPGAIPALNWAAMSAGLTGLAVFCGLALYRTRVTFCFWYFLFIRPWFKLPLVTVILLWAGLQLFRAQGRLDAFNASFLAHLGGALAGLLIWMLRRMIGKAPGADLAPGG